MSDIVLSASVRQNLLSLQSTADLLATTQNRLATGKKVNTALDNPTNYFTAAALDNRASDISNLLDGIGNGVQVLQAANTGITSLQSLVDSAKSVANQALQAAVGYSSKSSTTVTIAGATADNLLGGVATNAVATGTSALAALNLSGGASTNAVATGTVALDTTTTAATAGAFTLTAANFAATSTFGTGDTLTFDLTVDGAGSPQTVSISQADVAAVGNNDNTIDSVSELADAINNSNTLTGATASVDTNGNLVITSSTTGVSSTVAVSNIQANDTSGAGTITDAGLGAGTSAGGAAATGGIDVSGGSKAFTIALDGGAATTVTLSATGGTNGDGHYSADDVKSAINTALTGASVTDLAATVDGSGHVVLTSTSATTGTGDTIAVADVSSSGLTAALGLAPSTTGSASAGASFDINGQTVTFAGGSSYTATQIKDAINTQVGTTAHVAATIDGTGHLVLTSTGTAGASDAVALSNFTGSGFDGTSLGFATAAPATVNGADSSGSLSGLTLNIAATGNGTATAITFGTASGNVKSLNDLNNALAANNLQATLGSGGKLTISTTNDAASSTIGAITGTATDTGNAFNGLTISGPVQDQTALLNRSNLVAQYNNILDQINTTSQDASFNGINLLNGDQLKLTFNETGTSTLKIQGVTFNAAGLQLSKLTAGTDFLDNSSANSAIASLDNASSTLRTEASALGSNLSIVQIRQDFSKNMINVLQTGSSNLTLADTNEEAANSQALSTRQSIAVSALALANQSQQSVLQLLR